MTSTEPPTFHTKVEVRWSDMDVFQHINHARMVTLLEEARIPWLFAEGRPTLSLRDGCVIADVHVRYRGQLRHDDTPLDVAMWITQLRAVDFTIGYEVRAARSDRPNRPPSRPRPSSRPSTSARSGCDGSRLPNGSFLAWIGVPERGLYIADPAERGNLLAFAGAVLRLDEAAVIRLRRRPMIVWAPGRQRVSTYSRAVRWRRELNPADATVAADVLVEQLRGRAPGRRPRLCDGLGLAGRVAARAGFRACGRHSRP